jgi:selT/selW/selH-like putative selenoprotein
MAVKTAISDKFGDVEFNFNPMKPRKGAFEIKLVKDGAAETLLWSGLAKGPPRKLKFPETEEILKQVEENLQ